MNRDGGAYQRPMTVFWSLAHRQRHVTICRKRYILANANSRSRSLYAIARPSVVCLSVTLVRPTQAVQIFGNISTALDTLAIH